MRQEIEHQAADMQAALQAVIAPLVAVSQKVVAVSRLISVGIGDSHLVGRLATEAAYNRHDGLRAVSAEEVLYAGVEPGCLAFCQSISGTTSITVAATRFLKEHGAFLVAVSGEQGTPLSALADLEIALTIPRYPPDAKVPGTITVTIPLAAILSVLAIAQGTDAYVALHDIVAQFRTVFSRAPEIIERQSQHLAGLRAVHIVSPPDSAVAAYLQSKLAETLGITASVSAPEEWLHTAKHAVSPGVLVVALGARLHPALTHAISSEATTRGGAFVASHPQPDPIAVPPVELLCRLRPLPPPVLDDLLLEVAFSQHLCLHLLEQDGDWAPFQLHRLTKEVVRGYPRRRWL
jgi:fructoselysine-6-P-deglycase FrlB-like protein